jgi:hypothetical protein
MHEVFSSWLSSDTSKILFFWKISNVKNTKCQHTVIQCSFINIDYRFTMCLVAEKSLNNTMHFVSTHPTDLQCVSTHSTQVYSVSACRRRIIPFTTLSQHTAQVYRCVFTLSQHKLQVCCVSLCRRRAIITLYTLSQHTTSLQCIC